MAQGISRVYSTLLSNKELHLFKQSSGDSLEDPVDPATGQFLPGRDNPLGVVDLKSVYRVIALADKSGFQVNTVDATWIFYAASDSDRAIWMIAISDLTPPLPISRYQVVQIPQFYPPFLPSTDRLE